MKWINKNKQCLAYSTVASSLMFVTLHFGEELLLYLQAR